MCLFYISENSKVFFVSWPITFLPTLTPDRQGTKKTTYIGCSYQQHKTFLMGSSQPRFFSKFLLISLPKDWTGRTIELSLLWLDMSSSSRSLFLVPFCQRLSPMCEIQTAQRLTDYQHMSQNGKFLLWAKKLCCISERLQFQFQCIIYFLLLKKLHTTLHSISRPTTQQTVTIPVDHDARVFHVFFTFDVDWSMYIQRSMYTYINTKEHVCMQCQNVSIYFFEYVLFYLCILSWMALSDYSECVG
jgi:hypothetical protein